MSDTTKVTSNAPVLNEIIKFINYGYTEYITALNLFDNIEEQQSFINSFITNKQKEDEKKLITYIKQAVEDFKNTKTTDITKNTSSEELTEEPMIENTSTTTEEPIIENINNAIDLAKTMTAKKPRKKSTPKKLTKKLEKEWELLVKSNPPVYNDNPSSLSNRIANILVAKTNGENVCPHIIQIMEEQKSAIL